MPQHISHSRQANNSNNVNLSGYEAATRVLNLDMIVAKRLERMGWTNANIFAGNVIFFSKTTLR